MHSTLLCYMRIFQQLIILSVFFWAGAIVAISFLEAPLKFTAPNITTELGLGIGRIVFHALNKIEWIFEFTLLISLFYVKRERIYFLLSFLITAILVYQTFLLLPQLDVRAELLLNGNRLPASYHHWLYILLELIKLLSLLTFGIIFTRKNLK